MRTAGATAASLTVCNWGPGIADADRERIFERFQRAAQPGPDDGVGPRVARRPTTRRHRRETIGASSSVHQEAPMYRQARERIITLEVTKLELRQAAERARRPKVAPPQATAHRLPAPRGQRV